MYMWGGGVGGEIKAAEDRREREKLWCGTRSGHGTTKFFNTPLILSAPSLTKSYLHPCNMVSQKYYWPGLTKDVRSYVSS